MSTASSLSLLRMPLEVHAAQLVEIWSQTTDKDAVDILRRVLNLADAAPNHSLADDDPRLAIWADAVYETLLFAKQRGFSSARAQALLSLMQRCYLHAAESDAVADGLASVRAAAYKHFKAALIETLTALGPSEQYSVADVKAIIAHLRSVVFDHVQLISCAHCSEQPIFSSKACYFIQQPAIPMPLALGEPIEVESLKVADVQLDGDAAAATEEAAAEAEADAETGSDAAYVLAEAAAEDAADVSAEAAAEAATDVEPAEAPDVGGATDDGDEEPSREASMPSSEDVSEAVSRALEARVSALQASYASSLAERERALLERVGL